MQACSPLLYDPCVFLAGDAYQIAFPTAVRGMAWVEVAGALYADEIHGLMRSEETIHKIAVPQRALDAARGYTLRFQPMIERRPYASVTGEVFCRTYAFFPPNAEDCARLYVISDTHSKTELPIRAGGYFGDAPHLLVFNGDIADKSDSVDNILTLYRINGALTGGTRPILFARGNHDTRGICAPGLERYVGTHQGNPYFTFRVGSLWGIVLDCGEDKLDAHVEYGGTARFEPFRRQETQFLAEVLGRRDRECDAPGVRWRVAICHIPFTVDHGKRKNHPDFGIEAEVYSEWTRLLNDMGIDVLLSGHTHSTFVSEPGGPMDAYGQRFPAVVGGAFRPGAEGEGPSYVAMAITLRDGKGEARFTDDRHRALSTFDFPAGSCAE